MSAIADGTPGESDEPRGRAERWAQIVGGGWIFFLLIGLVAVFSILKPGQFGSTYNLSLLATNAAIYLVLSLGQTFVIVAAGVDLSVGAVLVFSSVIAARLMLALSGAPANTYGTTTAGWDIVAMCTLVAMLAGTAWGVLNGVLVALARIPPLIVTLGTLGMALGSAQIITNGQDVRAVPEVLVSQIGFGTILGMPCLVVIAVACTVVAAIVLHLTRFGLRTFAVGSSAEASRRAGIPVKTHIIRIYAVSGLVAGIAGIMSIARFSTTTIGGHSMDNLTVISAVVLGGTSLFGGVGTIAGTIVGVFIPIVLLNGFVILGIPPFWQTVTMGAVLIIAVWVDQIKRRARERG